MAPPVPHVDHEKDHRAVVDDQLRKTSTQVHIPNAVVAAGANPTKAEYDTVVAKLNLVLGVLRDAELLPSS